MKRDKLFIVSLENETLSGDDGEEVTPVPIPNTEVKLFSANGTWVVAPWESRTLPGKPLVPRGFYFLRSKNWKKICIATHEET
jgi:hypothetical protein